MSTLGVPPTRDGTIRCPRCSAALLPEQDWCLNCGAPARTRLAPRPNWRAPIVLIATVAVISVLVLVLAFVSLTNGGGDSGAAATTGQTGATGANGSVTTPASGIPESTPSATGVTGAAGG